MTVLTGGLRDPSQSANSMTHLNPGMNTLWSAVACGKDDLVSLREKAELCICRHLPSQPLIEVCSMALACAQLASCAEAQKSHCTSSIAHGIWLQRNSRQQRYKLTSTRKCKQHGCSEVHTEVFKEHNDAECIQWLVLAVRHRVLCCRLCRLCHCGRLAKVQALPGS